MITHDLSLLVRKLQTGGPLPDKDVKAILDLPYTRKSVSPAAYISREGEPPRSCAILISGFAFRHKIVCDGGRQIVSLHVPGEPLDFQGIYLDCADHNVQALTAADLAIVPMTEIRSLVENHPMIAKAVILNMLIEASILREWITNIGRRDARSRLAHFLCEFASRLDAQGLAQPSYRLPMTQEQIGDALGLTAVHVNRSIKALETEGLVSRSERLLTFPNIEKLREVGDFSDLYLHLGEQSKMA